MRSAAAVTLVGVVLLAGCSSSPPKHEVSLPGPPTILTTTPPSPTPTPTTDARYRAAQAALRAATVELVQRGGALGPWRQECTGTKIRVGKRTYVLTARHCVADHLDKHTVFPSLGTTAESMTAPDLHRPVDVTSRMTAMIGVRAIDAAGRASGSIAVVTKVVAQWYPDVALLSIRVGGDYADVPALNYVPEVELGLETHEATTFGLPAAAGKRLQGHGTYLGRVQNPSDPTQLLDLIGLHPSGPTHDACNYGASGSLAVIEPGSFTGPLAVRNNVVNKAGSNGEDDPTFDRKDRKGMAEQLDTSLAGYATVCGYAELTRKVLNGLVAAGR